VDALPAIGRAITFDVSRLERAIYAEAVEAGRSTIKSPTSPADVFRVRTGSGAGQRSAPLRRATRPASAAGRHRFSLHPGHRTPRSSPLMAWLL